MRLIFECYCTCEISESAIMTETGHALLVQLSNYVKTEIVVKCCCLMSIVKFSILYREGNHHQNKKEEISAPEGESSLDIRNNI